MSTECGRDEHCQEPERAEEAFDALSSGRRAPKVSAEGNPWKVASAVLLVLALVLPLVFAIRQSRRDDDWRSRVEAARAEVAAVDALLEMGNLSGAVVALHDIGMKLSPVEGAEEASFRLGEAVEGLEEQVVETRKLLARRAEVAASELGAVGALLEGSPDRAVAATDPIATEDPLAEALSTLARRLILLSRAEAEEGDTRVARLRALAGEWALPGIAAAHARADRDIRTAREVEQGVLVARAALVKGDGAKAREGISRALRSAGLGEADGVLAGVRRRERIDRAKRLEEEGKLLPAAALYRTVAIEGGTPDVVTRALDLERRIERGNLVKSLDTLAEEAVRGGAHARAAALLETSARLSPGENVEERAQRARGRWLRTMAESYRELGDLEAARVHAEEAATLGDVPAKRLAEEIGRLLKRRDDLARVERAEAALRDGAAAHAAKLIEGVAAPGDVGRRIEEGLREDASEKARALLHAGDGAGALEVLTAAGLRDAGSSGALVGTALLMTGEVDAALSRLPRDDDVRVRALRGVALHAAASGEPARAAALLSRCLSIAGRRVDLVADLALALERGGDPEKTKAAWEALRNAALEKAPLPEEKGEPAEEAPKPEGG